MAAEGRRTDPAVEAAVFREPWAHSFFEAVRHLEALAPQRKPVGRDADPALEVARFCARPSLEFPASEVHDLEPGTGEAPPRMTVQFLGLFGSQGTLPRHYTTLVEDRLRVRDRTLRDFLDLFNHRLISLFFRAWEKYRFYVSYPRGQDCRLTEYLFCLIGMGTAGLRGRLDVRDEVLVYYSGLLAQYPRSAVALEGILGDYFGLPVRVEQFQPRQIRLNPEDRTRLGRAAGRLGVDATVGASIHDVQGKFRLRFGPLTLRQFEDFLPDGTALRRAVQLTRLFAGPEFDFDVQLVLRRQDVPPCRLGAAGVGARLGWTGWMRTAPAEKDADDAVFAIE
jgi:type VI secretion system protein ImpH